MADNNVLSAETKVANKETATAGIQVGGENSNKAISSDSVYAGAAAAAGVAVLGLAPALTPVLLPLAGAVAGL
jgi:hypothetical protein